MKALEKEVANLTLIHIKALEKEITNLRTLTSGDSVRGGRGAHRGRGGRGGARGGARGAARGGRGGLRSGAGTDEQEPRLCVVCGVPEHLAEDCPKADPTAVARIKKRREDARARNADRNLRRAQGEATDDESEEFEFELGGLNDSSAEGHCFSASTLSPTSSAQHTVHFHPATIFLDYHKPVTRRRRLNELSCPLTCVGKHVC